MADTLAVTAAVITGVTGFAGRLALKYLGPKSQVVYWQPHSSFFQIPIQGQPAPLNIMTNAVTVQNLGWRPATSVEVVYTAPPPNIKVTPARAYTPTVTPEGKHVLVFPSLGHNEWFTLEVLGFGVVPFVEAVRSADGPAKTLAVTTQRVWPRWVNFAFAILLLVGSGYVVYWILRGLQALAKALGWVP